MKKSRAFYLQLFLSFRPLNLFFLLLTQILCVIFLLKKNLFSENFFFVALSTQMSAAGGYLLNDIFDRKNDLINYPKRGKFSSENSSLLLFLGIFLVILSSILGFVISNLIGILVLFCNQTLVFYAKYSKKIGLLKPILVSFLTSFSIGLISLVSIQIWTWESFVQIPNTVWFFSVWAFLLSMIREMIKDLEDWQGDKQQQSFTSAIQFGKKNSFIFIKIFVILLIISLLISFWVLPISSLNFFHRTIMALLLLYFLTLLKKDNSITNYKKLSSFCKILMLVGILGMVCYL